MKIKTPYRPILLLVITLLLIKEIILGILMTDIWALTDLLIYVFLLYLIVNHHAQTKVALYSWALFYLLMLTGIKAVAKTLVIVGGNGWEINSMRYYTDIFLVFLGIGILIFGKKMFLENKS